MSHRVNGIIIQPGYFAEIVSDFAHPKRKRCRRSFKVNTEQWRTDYLSGKRIGPKNLTFPGNEDCRFLLDEQSRINTAWILSHKSSIPQAMPSWTGFNIKIRDNITPNKCSVGYLKCLDSPASDMSTIFEILNRCLPIKDKLKLSAIVCIFDQAIYAKAVEIKWKMLTQYKDCILMLGMFHMLMMYFGIIRKRFKDAGLHNILILWSQGGDKICFNCPRADQHIVELEFTSVCCCFKLYMRTLNLQVSFSLRCVVY